MTLRRGIGLVTSLFTAAVLASACGGPTMEPDTPPPPVSAPINQDIIEDGQGAATPEEAKRFVEQVDKDLRELMGNAERVAWVKMTYITHDTEILEAKAQEQVMEYLSRKIKEARRFEGLDLPPDVARQLYLLKFSAELPAPDDEAKRKEFAGIVTKLDSIYGKGEYCSKKLIGHALPKGKTKKDDDGCRSLEELSQIIGESRDYDLLLEAWQGWRTISKPMRPMYQRFVELGNEGAKEIGFSDMGAIWKGHYDMSDEEFVAEMDRLYVQVKPLYEQLHCYVRAKLSSKYGKDKVDPTGGIPAHLLGNMWAQEWEALYKELEPYPGKGQPDLTAAMKKQKYDHTKMVKLAEGFFTSLGMKPLPQTFWERSLFLKPADRDVVCHASAWDVGMSGDLRIKMCIKVDYEDLVTIHHELGHNYYFMYYHDQPVLFQQGANDGFHEGIGDTLALGVTPAYLKQIGLIDKVQESKEADINLLMSRALEGVAFLPFGKMIDQWRWDVFSGKVPPTQYNAHWWKLRKDFQGIVPPVERTEQDFDPGAKYHIPGNTPYIRYYIARILQYQFLRALCREAGFQGPLYQCTFYGNKAAGEKMMAMLKLGASKPWPEALAAISGETKMDASAILDYYAPLMKWLEEKNQGQKCGW